MAGAPLFYFHLKDFFQMHKLRFINGTRTTPPTPALLFMLLLAAFGSFSFASAQAQNTKATTSTAGSPSEAVRQFYKALSEKRFREALAMSVYGPAIEGLSQKDLDELRPDFESLATGAEKVEVKGEQVSGDSATVFVKLKDDAPAVPPLPVQMKLVKGNWIIYDEDVEKAVKKEGNKYFFNARIKSHEDDAQTMLMRIAQSQLVYSAQHNGTFGDLQALIKEKLVPEDVLTPQSTGYNFHVMLSVDKKSYTAGAEPAAYNRSGKLSFYMDSGGIKSADTGGKPYTPKK
jgi:Tfp pilus assembly protein PilE